MKSIYLTAGAFLLFAMALSSLRAFWVDRQFNALSQPQNSSMTLTNNSLGGVVLREKRLESLRELSNSSLHAARIHVEIFSLISKKASETTHAAERMRLYCEALSEIGSALRYEPANAQYLINWANIRQILGESVECSLPYTNGDFAAVTQLALRNDPTNVDVLFAAAHLYEWAGKNDEGNADLKQTLLLSTKLKPFQLEYIASRMRTPHDVESILPARFPQIADWSMRIHNENPDLFVAARSVLEKFQFAAIEEALSDYRNGDIPHQLHKQRLLSLFDFTASAAVRRRLDKELASFWHSFGEEQLAAYLLERSKYEEAAINDSAVASDTRPLKSVLTQWRENSEICLDDFYSSIGFYLPTGASPKVIELHGRKKDSQIAVASLKVFVSDDNQAWSELQGNIQISSLQFGDSKIVAIQPNSGYFKYWKINFSSSVRTKSFCNSAQRMLAVYRTSGGVLEAS